MKHSEFKSLVINVLGDKINESGATLYSASNTLRRGRLLIMGLNPGGSEEMTIARSLDQIEHSDYNEYTAVWSNGGQHPLQKNIRVITRQLGLETKDVCATNLIFRRSVAQEGAEFKSRHLYWPIHEQIIQVVQPQVIIAFGNGPVSPYRHLYDVALNKVKSDPIDSGHGKFVCVTFKGTIANVETTVIGLPHLSRYHLYTDNPAKKRVLDWIKGKSDVRSAANNS